MIRKHIEADESDITRMEGIGAMNFLALDDIVVTQEGEQINPDSIISLPTKDGKIQFPKFECSTADPFLQSINASGKKWVIIVDEDNQPNLVLNANAFLRMVHYGEGPINPYIYCHQPIIVNDPHTLLGKVISKLKVYPESTVDDVIDDDLILIWSTEKRVITGADILGRLLRGIALRDMSKPQA